MTNGWDPETPYTGTTGHRTYVVRQRNSDSVRYSAACLDCGWKGRTHEGASYFPHADAIEHAGSDETP